MSMRKNSARSCNMGAANIIMAASVLSIPFTSGHAQPVESLGKVGLECAGKIRMNSKDKGKFTKRIYLNGPSMTYCENSCSTVYKINKVERDGIILHFPDGSPGKQVTEIVYRESLGYYFVKHSSSGSLELSGQCRKIEYQPKRAGI
jgi:hypothetical protein